MNNTLINTIENLRNRLHESIERNEVSHKETIKISQELDRYLNIYAKSLES